MFTEATYRYYISIHIERKNKAHDRLDRVRDYALAADRLADESRSDCSRLFNRLRREGSNTLKPRHLRAKNHPVRTGWQPQPVHPWKCLQGNELAPQAGFEPATLRLTAGCRSSCCLLLGVAACCCCCLNAFASARCELPLVAACCRLLRPPNGTKTARSLEI